LTLKIDTQTHDDILSGVLECQACARSFPIRDGIPRFVQADENYSENFGVQWRSFRAIQVDRIAGHTLTQSRFLKDTGWSPEWLKGKLVFDGGAGAGRFSDVMAQFGARVVACDLSSAVDACRANEYDTMGRSSARGEIETVQGSLLNLPFKSGVFDAVHCAGVIQHIPDPDAAMSAMPALAKNGAPIFYNFYEIDPMSKFQVFKYLMRRITPDWPISRIFIFSRWLCRLFFIPSYIMSRIPKVRFFNRFLPICSVHHPHIALRQQYEMTLLDTIDWYGPKYEIRQDHKQVGRLMESLGLTGVRTANGIAHATKGSVRGGLAD
jgi:SAM-dependent methyltransferase